MSTLTSEVADAIGRFIENQTELMFNELDFQIQLALFLRESGRYDDVEVEYSLPRDMIDDYVWKSNLRIDLVVSRGGRYCPIELKYPTRKVDRPIGRFGESAANVTVMKNQGAQDLVRYNFWKDVCRIESLARRFKSVDGGVAVVMTNDESYLRPVRPTSTCAPFCTAEGHTVGPGTVDWLNSPKVRESHMPFTLRNSYTMRWRATAVDGIPFHYCVLEI